MQRSKRIAQYKQELIDFNFDQLIQEISDEGSYDSTVIRKIIFKTLLVLEPPIGSGRPPPPIMERLSACLHMLSDRDLVPPLFEQVVNMLDLCHDAIALHKSSDDNRHVSLYM